MKLRNAFVIAIAIIIVGGLAWAGTTHFTNLGVTTDLSVGNDLTVGGDASVTGSVTMGTIGVDDLTIDTSLNLDYSTASRAVYLDASKNLVASLVTNTELGYLDGVTSAIQGQLDLLAPIDSPAFTTQMDISDWATVSEALVTDGSGMVVTATGVSATEVGYLDGVTSGIQGQLNLLAPIDSPAFTTEIDISNFGTASELLVTDASSNIVTLTGVSSTEAGYLDGVTSGIQGQLNLLAPIDSPSFTTLLDLDYAAGSLALATNASGNIVEVSGVSDTELGYLASVTSDIQAQLDAMVDDPGTVTDDLIVTWDGTDGHTVQDAVIGINDDGDIFTANGDIVFTTNSLSSKTQTAPIGYVSATEFQTAFPFSAFTSAGIEAGGQPVIGSADAFISLSDAADEINLGFTVPGLASPVDAADLVIEFDILEDTDEELNIDVVMYEYGSGAAIVTDTITIANAAGRAWVGLDTAATGVGNVIDVGEFILIKITATADTDQFKLYGARVTFLTGIQNNAS